MAGDITIKKTKGFTTILNAPFQRNDLSWKAKGLLAYLLTCSEDWVIFKKDLKNRSTDGYDSTVTAFSELENAGYIDVIENRDNGLFSSPTYIVHESPIRDFPDTVFPDTVFPRLISNSLKKGINKGLPKKTKDERKLEFKNSLTTYLKTEKNPKGYLKENLREFFDYWVETDDKTTKLRFETQVVFDLSRRLARFRFKDTTVKQQQRGQSYQGGEVGN